MQKEKTPEFRQPNEFKAADPSEIREALTGYVEALASTFEFDPDKLQTTVKLPAQEKLTTALSRVPDAHEIRFAIDQWGNKTGLNISSETKREPKHMDRQTQVGLLLEAAARNLAVSRSELAEGVTNALIRLRAKGLKRKFLAQAQDLIEGKPLVNKTRKALEAASVLALAAAACSAVVSPTVEGNDNQPVATATIDAPEFTATPTELPIPSSLKSQETALRQAGYEVQPTPEGVQLVNREGEPVLRSTEAATITITTKDSETLIFPQEDFEVRKTIGAGMENLLTVKDPEGNVEYFFLERAGYWATPLEWFTDPTEIENYPEIDLEDIWNGRAAQTAALNAEPFPEGTLVPREFDYYVWEASGIDHFVTLNAAYPFPLPNDANNAMIDFGGPYFEDVLRKNNDPQRWIAFYKTTTPEGREAVIGTQQIMAPDGETSIFLQYIFGHEWPWEDDSRPSGAVINLVESVFLNRSMPSVGRGGNQYARVNLVPVVFIEYGDFPRRGFLSNFTGSEAVDSAAEELYPIDRNNPLLIRSDLPSRIDKAVAEMTGYANYVGQAGSEIQELQYLTLGGFSVAPTHSQYFENN